jgi:hypothetical protein
MLHIILFLIRIIGIILISILGLLLLLLILALLVPIRYRLNAGNRDYTYAIANVSWLYRVLYFEITYLDKHFVLKFRILGKIFFDSDKPKEKVKKGIKRIGRRIDRKVKKSAEKTLETQAEKQLEEHDEEPAKKNNKDYTKKSIDEKPDTTENVEINVNKATDSNNVISDNTGQDKEVDSNKQTDELEPEYEEQLLVSKKTSDLDEDQEYLNSEYSIKKDNHKKKDKKTSLLKNFFLKIKDFFRKIKNFFINFIKLFFNIKDKLAGLRRFILNCKMFLKNEENRSAIKHMSNSLVKVLKHIRPTKLSVNMEFGTGDPCTTGQALAVIALFYGYYGESIRIIPNFETSIAEGSIYIKGRIRLFTLLVICIKLILDKNFRLFLKNIKSFKEEL